MNLEPNAMSVVEIYPGAFHVPAFLTLDEQRGLVDRVQQIADGPVGFYRPQVRGGGHMRCEILCLGRHWDAMTYTYESTRTDYDDQPVPQIPPELLRVAVRAAEVAGFAVHPDICLINRYDPSGKMGLHQDKDETPSTLEAGVPIVSLSFGATARLVVGGFRRRDETTALALHAGDAFVMGGPSRLRYHGVTRLLNGTEPTDFPFRGRLNLTFRQYDLHE